MPKHSAVVEGSNHIINDADHADIATLEVATPGASDIGKVHMVSHADYNSYWAVISSTAPRFARINTEIYNTVTTVNATPTTITSITLNDEETYIFEVRLIGQVGGDASDNTVIGKRFVYYRTSAGSATSLGSDDMFSHDSGGSWAATDLTVSVSTSTVSFQVTGIAATSIDWKIFVDVRKSF